MKTRRVKFSFFNKSIYTRSDVLSRKISRPDLEAADLDGDKSVSAAEFVVYKLKEMGKINDEDVSDVLEWFRKLDVDKSGTLTEADII
ncbi:hypothetical protein AAHE18_11G180900 [Arachis hypogaea]